MDDQRLDKLDRTGYLKDVSCGVFAQFDLVTDGDMHGAHDLLAAQNKVLRKTAFADLEQRFGLSYNPRGAIPIVRPG